MKIIFLDIDGVLNNEKNTIKTFNKIEKLRFHDIIQNDICIFDKKSLEYLGKIVDRYEDDVLVVISSTWRLDQRKVDKIIEKISENIKSWSVRFSITDRDENMIRGNEIEKYLKSHNLLKEDYIIIDDDTEDIIGEKYKDNMDFKSHFVWCDRKVGFKRKEYKRAIKLLKGRK